MGFQVVGQTLQTSGLCLSLPIPQMLSHLFSRCPVLPVDPSVSLAKYSNLVTSTLSAAASFTQKQSPHALERAALLHIRLLQLICKTIPSHPEYALPENAAVVRSLCVRADICFARLESYAASLARTRAQPHPAPAPLLPPEHLLQTTPGGVADAPNSAPDSAVDSAVGSLNLADPAGSAHPADPADPADPIYPIYPIDAINPIDATDATDGTGATDVSDATSATDATNAADFGGSASPHPSALLRQPLRPLHVPGAMIDLLQRVASDTLRRGNEFVGAVGGRVVGLSAEDRAGESADILHATALVIPSQAPATDGASTEAVVGHDAHLASLFAAKGLLHVGWIRVRPSPSGGGGGNGNGNGSGSGAGAGSGKDKGKGKDKSENITKAEGQGQGQGQFQGQVIHGSKAIYLGRGASRLHANIRALLPEAITGIVISQCDQVGSPSVLWLSLIRGSTGPQASCLSPSAVTGETDDLVQPPPRMVHASHVVYRTDSEAPSFKLYDLRPMAVVQK